MLSTMSVQGRSVESTTDAAQRLLEAAADAFAAGQPVVTRSPADAVSQAYINIATSLVERMDG